MFHLICAGKKPETTDTSRENLENEANSEQRETDDKEQETQDQESEEGAESEDDKEETDGGEEGVEEGSTKEQDESNQQGKEEQEEAEEGGNNQGATGDPSPNVGQWGADQKVAWIVPFLAAPAMPSYAAFCFNTIAFSSPQVQVFVFYENASMILPSYALAQTIT